MPFLYLKTKGWKTGRLHEIEIWYVEHQGAYYVVSELRERSHWVQNIRHGANVAFRVGATRFEGVGRVVKVENELELTRNVARLMKESYDWSDGLIVELRPKAGAP